MPDRIEESARSRLLASSYPTLRSVGCSCHDGVLTLAGCVPSYYQKQLAQAIVSDLDGIREVVNHIRVANANPRAPIGRDEGWRGASAR